MILQYYFLYDIIWRRLRMVQNLLTFFSMLFIFPKAEKYKHPYGNLKHILGWTNDIWPVKIFLKWTMFIHQVYSQVLKSVYFHYDWGQCWLIVTTHDIFQLLTIQKAILPRLTEVIMHYVTQFITLHHISPIKFVTLC